MLCPVCKIPLMMADRHGVEINYCPTCRGVWVDRGGLDKIIDRASALSAGDRAGNTDRHDDDRERHAKQGRRKSFFSELFD
jgi:uncharacterized protein